jgi:hypothetical protein
LKTEALAKELKINRCTGGNSPPLKVLLRELGCRYSNLHNAGNDENFTLRALLLQGIKTLGKETTNNDTIERIEALESIAAIPESMTKMIQYPPTDAELEMRQKEIGANEAKRQWKRERRRIRTPEEQQLIRDARLQRRIHATPEKLASLEREDELRRRRERNKVGNKGSTLEMLLGP